MILPNADVSFGAPCALSELRYVKYMRHLPKRTTLTRLHQQWVAVLVWFAIRAMGYHVGPTLNLEKLTAEANIIFKATVVSSSLVEDESFKPCQGFVVQETQFKIITMLKGESATETMRFRHYDRSPSPGWESFAPQYYHFQTARTYIVFAKSTDTANVVRQAWMNHTGKIDQGMLLCPDDQPVKSGDAKEVFWSELTAMLKSGDAGDVIYAIGQLDQMSGLRDEYSSTKDFDRKDVLVAIHEMLTTHDEKIAQRAIAVFGSGNPYLSDDSAEYWLATVGSAEVPGIGTWDPKMRNLGGELYWKDLVAIADGKMPTETRTRAIRALGLVREPSLRKPLQGWLADAEPAVRAAAAVLLADFLGPDTRKQLTALATDAAPVVRADVARAIGYSQEKALAGLLGRFLEDKDAKVRRAAAMSLLSFSPKSEAVARVFRAHLNHREFRPLFVNALACEKLEPYLEAVARIVEEKTDPTNWPGGEIPAYTAWKMLFGYLRSQPVAKVRAGKLDRYLEAMEKVGHYSSSEPRDIYAFYLQRGMTERAKSFRDRSTKTVSYNLDYYFDQVDKSPATFQGP